MNAGLSLKGLEPEMGVQKAPYDHNSPKQFLDSCDVVVSSGVRY